MRTIRSSREIERVFHEGVRFAHPVAAVFMRETGEERGPAGRVAFVAGKRLGSAVLRNRSKRVLREAVRRAEGPWPGLDAVLVARPKTAGATAEEADEMIKATVETFKARRAER